ncbi:hypothetical protein KL912_000520 [Ogataea haglerorum]|nr:hypothetical protein KL912_000520 [Ogataea haglerorum]
MPGQIQPLVRPLAPHEGAALVDRQAVCVWRREPGRHGVGVRQAILPQGPAEKPSQHHQGRVQVSAAQLRRHDGAGRARPGPVRAVDRFRYTSNESNAHEFQFAKILSLLIYDRPERAIALRHRRRPAPDRRPPAQPLPGPARQHRPGQRVVEPALRRAARHTPPPRSYAQITSEDEIKLTFQHDTVIHTACSNNAHRSLELLLAYFSVCIDQRGHHGYTASHVCCVANFALCLGVLLENGAYPNIQDDDGNSPLHLALEYGALDCIDLLVAYKADGQLVNNAGWKPEDLAYDFEVLSRYKAMQTRPPALASLPSLASQPSDAPGPLNAKVSLPSIQHRKFSLSSHASSDSDTDDQYVGDSNSVSTSSSLRLTRDPSPVSDAAQGPSSSNSLASVHEHRPGLARKAPPTPPRKLSIPPPASVTSSLSTQSPASKRSSMSMRNFRSNSQTSESSPMKPQNRLSRPHAQSSPVVPENEPVPVPASKLSNFRLQNENRVKLGLKLDSMMRSQESLAQEAASEPGVPRVMRSNTEPAADHAQKRSRILSIPIASLRSRKN